MKEGDRQKKVGSERARDRHIPIERQTGKKKNESEEHALS